MALLTPTQIQSIKEHMTDDLSVLQRSSKQRKLLMKQEVFL